MSNKVSDGNPWKCRARAKYFSTPGYTFKEVESCQTKTADKDAEREAIGSKCIKRTMLRALVQFRNYE